VFFVIISIQGQYWAGRITGAALLENNEAATKLTIAIGGTFTWAQLDSVANHVTACSIGDWRALTWLATATGKLDVNVPPCAVVSLSVSTWFDTTWIEGTASRLYMCKSVGRILPPNNLPPNMAANDLLKWNATLLSCSNSRAKIVPRIFNNI